MSKTISNARNCAKGKYEAYNNLQMAFLGADAYPV